MENFKIEENFFNFQDSKIRRNGGFPENYPNLSHLDIDSRQA